MAYLLTEDNLLRYHLEMPCKYPKFIQEWFDRVYTNAKFSDGYFVYGKVANVSYFIVCLLLELK